MNCKIIRYTDDLNESLKDYLRKTFPRKSEANIEYCVTHSSDHEPSILVINDKDEIVGCHLLYCTKAMLCGKEIETQWGHDTYLDEDYRGEIGLEFMLFTNRFHGFGMGLSEINRELHKKLKTPFHEGVFSYYLLTRCIVFSPFQKLFHIKPSFNMKDEVRVNGIRFFLAKSVKEIAIPNKGYWYKDSLDLDFIRDESFLNQRFFHNNVFQYYIYSCSSENESCYFVVRLTSFHGCPALTLTDFRYNTNNPEITAIILKAVRRLAIISNIGIIVFCCGDSNMRKTMKGVFHRKRQLDFISGKKESIAKTFSITGADSDADFNRQ